MLTRLTSTSVRRQLAVFSLFLGVYALLAFVADAWFTQATLSTLPTSASTQPLPLAPWQLGLVNAGIVLIVYGGLGLLGYWLARKLAWPGIFAQQTSWRNWFFLPLLIGLMLGIVISAMDRLFAAFGTGTGLVHPTFPLSILASMAAGIGEEILFRMVVLGFWAFVLTILLGRWVQKPWLFWVANTLAALAFGAAHLPALMVLSGTSSLSSISPVVLLEVFLLNGLIGLTAGFWYRRQGLVAATGIHFWADIIWHVLWPLLF